jgi:hypothetical protein
LQRINANAYGNDPANWTAAPATAGADTITTDPAPEITAHPVDQHIVAGSNATFMVSASGANLEYQWHFNGSLLPGASSATLQLNNAQAEEAGDYEVVVYNPSGSAVSRVATLRVDVPVVILGQPRSQNAFAGSNVTFTVAAYSSTPVTYQWRKNGDPIPGATTDTLALTNIDRDDEGDYTVIVSDAMASVTSDVATLIVLARARIIQFTQSAVVAVGSNASFTAEVTNNATLPLTFRWRTNNNFAADMILDEYVSTFTIFNVRTNQAYNVPVVVTNLAGAGIPALTTPLPTLTVVVPPTNQTAEAGANVTFSGAVYDPPVRPRLSRVQWQFNGSNIENATNLTLSVTNVQSANEGTYSLIVTNPFFVVTPFHAQLQVASLNPRLVEPQMLPGGHFQAILQATPSRSYAIEYSTNLTNWVLLRSVSATSQSTPVVDEDAPNSPQRFYRARLE